MPYKKKYRSNRRKGGLKSLIKREIEKNEDRKVEKKRFLGILGESFDIDGHCWSIFGASTGVAGAGTPSDQFYITLFQGPSATGTNQPEHDANTGDSIIENFPSNYNISMIGDEIFLENLFLRYRVYKTADADPDRNYTVRVMCIETYDRIENGASLQRSTFLEYQHADYGSGGTTWTGCVLSNVNRQIVKRVYHDRVHIVNDKGLMGGVKVDTISLKLNKKLIATQKGATPASGLAMTSVEAPDGTISVPNPNTLVRSGQKILQTPHIYLFAFSDQPNVIGVRPAIAIQSCFTLRYTDM